MTLLNGWIIYNGHLKTDKFLDYVNWFVQVAEHEGISIDVIKNDELLVITNEQAPLLSTSQPNDIALPNFVHFADKDLHLAQQLENLGIRLFNQAEAIKLCDNKALMHERLFQQRIPTPKTIVAPMIYKGMPLVNEQYLNVIAEQLGFPLIVKEAYGSFGQQVYLIESIDQLINKAKQLAGIEHIYQQLIDTSIGVDFRLNVVGDEVVAAMKRTSETDFRANVTAGGTTQPYTPTNDERALAVKATKAVGADFAGVDLLIGENGPIVCEVNSNPHIRSIYDCTGTDVAYPMIHHIKNRLQNSQRGGSHARENRLGGLS